MKQKIWKYIKENKIINITNLVVLLIFFLPFSYYYGHSFESEELKWIPTYLFNDYISIIFYIPIVIFTIVIQITKKSIYRETIFTLIIITYIFYFFGTLFALSFPMQDLSPGLGLLLILTLLPLIIILYKKEQLEQNKE